MRASAGQRLNATAILVVFILALGVGILVGYLLDDADADADDSRVSGPPTIESIVADPDAFLGDDVFFDGRVSEVLGPRSFIVRDHPAGAGRGLLVVSRDPIASTAATRAPILEGDLVEVEGEFRNDPVEELENDLGVTFDDEPDVWPATGEDVSEGASVPTVVADEVEVTPGLFKTKPTTTAAAIVGLPNEFLGAVTSVEGKVTDIRESGAFVLDDTLLVLWPTELPAMQKGDRVEVFGTVRRFDPDQSRFDPNILDDEFFGDHLGKPVIVAEAIEGASVAPQ